jgi:hypothetical protein
MSNIFVFAFFVPAGGFLIGRTGRLDSSSPGQAIRGLLLNPQGIWDFSSRREPSKPEEGADKRKRRPPLEAGVSKLKI